MVMLMAAGPTNAKRAARVLLCEDEGITLMQLRMSLTAAGCDIIGVAASGERAIEIASSTELDLILMDVNLQGPLDGVDAACRILADHFVPMIMLTASSHADNVRRAFGAGVCGYVVKPVSSIELLPLIKTLLESSPTPENLEHVRSQLAMASRRS